MHDLKDDLRGKGEDKVVDIDTPRSDENMSQGGRSQPSPLTERYGYGLYDQNDRDGDQVPGYVDNDNDDADEDDPQTKYN